MDIGTSFIYLFLFLALYFEVFLFITFFEKKPGEKTATKPRSYPSVSVIVPVWNEEKTLAGTLQSLLGLEYPKDKLQIIVVDDGSTDGTLSITNGFKKYSQIETYSKENGGKYTALNLGIVHATGELIGCLDADSFVTTDALTEVVKKFEEHENIMAIVPAMKVNRPHNPLELMQAVEYTFGIFYKKMFSNLSAISVLPGPFSIYRRDVFNRIGLFRHAHNTEDMEMAFRMHAHGLSIENAHTAVVYTNVPKTLRNLIKQRTRWSQGFLQNSRDYRYMYFNPRFGYFGFFILPFCLFLFLGGLYGALFTLYRSSSYVASDLFDAWKTQIPLHGPSFHFDWFFLNTDMLTFLILAILSLTLVAVLLGRRIAGADFGVGSIISYFALYGLIAPVWLMRATWGAVLARESSWR